MRCPRCRQVNPLDAKRCGGCGQPFVTIDGGHGQRSEPASSGPENCTWVRDGIACPHRWIVNAGGRKLCRQHSIEDHGKNPHQVRGNNLPPAYVASMYGLEAVERRKKWTQGNKIADDGERGTFAIASTYLRSPPARQREPGDDDEEI